MKRFFHHRKTYGVIIFVAAVLFLICVVPLFGGRETIVLTEQNMTPHWDERSVFYPEKVVLDKGIYSVLVESDTQEDYKGTIEGYAAGYYRRSSLIPETSFEVPRGNGMTELRITVFSNDASCRMELSGKNTSEHFTPATFTVSYVYRPLQSVFAFAFYTLIPFVVLLCFLVLFFHYADKQDLQGKWIVCALFFIGLIMSVPVLGDSFPTGPDTEFHIHRIVNIAKELSFGQVPVRIGSAYHSGYGYPVSIFYGELFLVFPAVLYMGGLPAWQCYNIAVIMTTVMILLFSQKCFCELAGNRLYGTFITVIYATSSRYFANLYTRGAFGEATALAFYPLIVLGFFRLFRDERESAVKTAWPLMAGFTGLLQSHTISFVQASVFSAVFCAILIRRLFRQKRIAVLAGAAAGTVLVNLWFLVPFMDYYFRHDIQAKTVLSIRDTATYPVRLLKNAGDDALGLPVIILFVIGLLIVTAMDKTETRNIVITVAVLGTVAAFMTTRWMPWYWMELHLPRVDALLGGQMEFATRYISPATVLVCVFSALCIRLSREGGRTAGIPLHYVFAVLALWSFVQFAGWANSKEGSTVAQRSDMITPGLEHAGENLYMFSDTNWVEWRAEEQVTSVGMLMPDGTRVEIDSQRKGTSIRCTVENTSGEPLQIVFPVWNYYGYVVEDDTQRFPVTEDEKHRVSITLPADYSGTLAMRFQEPWYWRVAELISAGSIVVLLFLSKKKRICQY